MPKISVIVPSYNVEAFLAEALDSVLNQTYSDWECIIVDDGSKDGTWKVAAEYCSRDSRFKLVRQENKGLPGARNTGLDNASGEFILPLDADDRIGPEYMAMAMEVFEKQPDTKLIYCKASLFGSVDAPWNLPEYSYDRLIAINHIFCTCFYRRADAMEAGRYDETFRTGYEDWDFLLRLLGPEDKVVRLDKVLFHYRQHSKGSAITEALRKEEALIGRIVAKYPEIYRPHQDKIIQYMRAFNELNDLKNRREQSKRKRKLKFKSLIDKVFRNEKQDCLH